jgi:hypothetical protein
MKHIIGTLLLCLLSLNVAAQPKVVERSAKKMPAWLNTAVDDYLVVSVTAASLAEAQSKVLNEITERIIRSVASNVSVASINSMSEVNTDGNIASKEVFAQVSKIKSANLPFLKGISQGKIEDLYWEKLQDKKAGTITYNYSVKYPFSRAEHQQLQREFEALDAEKSAQLKALEQKIGEIEAVEEIKQAITQLDVLQDYFFDEVRLTQAKGLQERYRQLYNALSLTGAFLENGKYQCQLLLDGNPVRVSAMPRVTSNCASQISVRPADGSFLITYNTEDCLPEEENTLLIRLQVEGKRLEQKAYLNEAGAGQTFSVVPEGKLILTADSVAERVIYNINVRLTMNNRGGLPFGLKAIELHVPELSTPLIFDDINAVYKSKGIIQIKAVAEGEFTAREKKTSPVSFISGSITVVNPQSGAVERLRLSLPYVTNWE